MTQVFLKVHYPLWRLRAARLVIHALGAIEWLFPGSINCDRWTEGLSSFVARGVKIKVE
ncbi:hypothetical protein [Pararhodobacter zhoushanensis]|uniref:Uncharacterized protein n=1 Tax=Pararhodobacter zhoushanensis TaxID=2479545 RepID=A0ABT3GYK2_9RHOB|nr:hypothetical protein [Pararhodobacter zhoushanensis]MCW1932614.1 hypothetical protein [Pararhodobacter zhoushanensis]